MRLFWFVCITCNYNNINYILPYKTIANNVRQLFWFVSITCNYNNINYIPPYKTIANAVRQLFWFVSITCNYNNINYIPPYTTIVNNVRQRELYTKILTNKQPNTSNIVPCLTTCNIKAIILHHFWPFWKMFNYMKAGANIWNNI